MRLLMLRSENKETLVFEYAVVICCIIYTNRVVLYNECMMKNILFTQKVKKYQGKYIAVSNDKVIASGKSAKEVFELAKKLLSGDKKVEGVYYVPQKEDLLTALCVSHTSN
jgi:ABC-type molybdate transport system substrate-binding protein